VRGHIPLYWIPDRKSPKSLGERAKPAQKVSLGWRVRALWLRFGRFIERGPYFKGDVVLADQNSALVFLILVAFNFFATHRRFL
jgi:hypothetical protein